MLRIYLFVFAISLCFFSYLSFTTESSIPQGFVAHKEIETQEKHTQETFTIYTQKRIHTSFACFQIALPKAYIMQQKDKNAKKIQSVQKGQKICLNFPQDIPNTKLKITLKEIESQWVRVTLMNDSVLLNGYIPINALKDWQKIDSKNFVESSSGGEILLENAPKITSKNLKSISGGFSIPHILQIAQDRLAVSDCESARTWLALAQQDDRENLAIYDLYVKLLMCEGQNDEALRLKQSLKSVRNKSAKTK